MEYLVLWILLILTLVWTALRVSKPTSQRKVPRGVQHIRNQTFRHLFSILWHCILRHISVNRIKRLVNDGVLSTLDFTDFDTCVDCIKGKQTKKSKKGAKRSSTILEIIHSDICCSDMDAHGQKYFITFIDDYLQFYVSLHAS